MGSCLAKLLIPLGLGGKGELAFSEPRGGGG